MKLHIKNATIVDQNSPYHNLQKDIVIDSGVISQIGDDLDVADAQLINVTGAIVSPGFVDIFADFSDPGYEYKETLQTGAKAALKGGYTAAMLVPNTIPCTENKTGVEYLLHEAKHLPISIYPIGAITHKTDGVKLTEMIEMQEVGAKAFSDGWQSIQHAGVLLKALQYVKAFDGIVMDLPNDGSLSANGFMHEGIVSTQMGLLGIPAIAEEMMVARNIALCQYANSKLHITGISTAKSIALIKEAKQNGIQITCSTAPYHLHLTDADVATYDTNAKVMNPLRTNKDVAAIRTALLDGTIDCVASHHHPQDLDNKKCEFAYAAYGMSTIEHTFNAVAAVQGITKEKIQEVLVENASTIFNLPKHKITENEKANLVVYTLDNDTTIESTTMISKSKNTAFDGKSLAGKIYCTINNEHIYIA